MYQAARLARERVRALEFIDTVALVDEFARSIRQELDYRLEARNAEQFHRNFAGHPHVRVPRVYWSYSRSRVLTLELPRRRRRCADIDLDPVTMEERRRLAYRIAEAWMTMIFRHGFFHADPHPANILVLEQADQIGLVDFGMAGKLTDDDIVEADAALHRRRQRERRARCRAPGRARRAVPAGQGGGVRRRAARALLPLLRRQPRRDRPDPGDPRGLRAHLPHEPRAADALRAARQGDRDARLGRASSSTRTSTSSRSRSRTRAS